MQHYKKLRDFTSSETQKYQTMLHKSNWNWFFAKINKVLYCRSKEIGLTFKCNRSSSSFPSFSRDSLTTGQDLISAQEFDIQVHFPHVFPIWINKHWFSPPWSFSWSFILISILPSHLSGSSVGVSATLYINVLLEINVRISFSLHMTIKWTRVIEPLSLCLINFLKKST